MFWLIWFLSKSGFRSRAWTNGSVVERLNVVQLLKCIPYITYIVIVALSIVYMAQIILSRVGWWMGGWPAGLDNNKANLSPAWLKLS